MDTFKLYNEGVTFGEFVNKDKDSYKEKTLEIYNSIDFDLEYVEKIKSVNRKINILVCAEMWCPDCMINVPVLEKMRLINDNINFSIVGKTGNEEFFKQFNETEGIKIPTFVIYDESFKLLGLFIEHPKKIKDTITKGNQPNIIVAMRKYRKGEYAQETLKDILQLII